jgi:hypothetical protein
VMIATGVRQEVLCWGPVWLGVHEDAPARLTPLPGLTEPLAGECSRFRPLSLAIAQPR